MGCRVLFLSLILVLAGSNGLAGADGPEISPDELLAGTLLSLDSGLSDIANDDEVMLLSDDMWRFLETHVDDRARSFVKLNQLVYAVISEGSFDLEYEETTRTAADTFRAKRGNCMSFTNMFVVMARAVGLDARFQEVDIPPDWTFNEDTYVLNLHINIYIDLGVTGKHIVDFNIEDFKGSYEMRVVSDQRALAHFFNNLGVERMQYGDITTAFFAFRRAIAENDSRFAPAWTNLGTLYNRQGLSEYAEAAYLQALEVDRSDHIAMSNLSALYQRRGDQEQARYYRNRVNSHRKQNPYYRYHMAREAFLAKDYDSAISHLKYAARKRRDEDRFCALLGLVYLHQGDEKKSQKWMARAEKLAETDALKQIYSSKIARLKSESR